MALAEAQLERLADAESHLREAVRICDEESLSLESVMARNTLGAVLRQAGRRDEAGQTYQEAASAAADCGAAFEQARALRGLADLSISLNPREAADLLADALALLQALGSREATQVEETLTALRAGEAGD
jgi:tetratricopeptide (TPR) repeat protein